MAYTVAQNASFLTFASVLQKIISFAYFTIVARFLGAGNTGSYFFAITFTTVFAVMADFGFGSVLTREAAKYQERSEEYLNTVFWSKIIFGLIAYLLVVLFANILGYPDILRSLIYLSGLTMFFDNLQGTFFGVFRAHKNLIYESIGIVISQLLSLVIGTVALFLKAPLIWLIAAYTIPSGIMVLYSGFLLRKALNLRSRIIFDKIIFKEFIVLAIPFALAGLLGRLYAFSDTLLMSKLLSEQHLGWWSVPYKISFAFQFIPLALSASVYPSMSTFSVSDPARVGELFEKSWKYLFFIVFPLAFGIMAISESVIINLFGEQYSPSIPVLRILLVSLIFSYLNIITGSLLNATNHQKIQTYLTALVLVLSISFNLILIPVYGIVGAAISALVTNFILWILGYYFVNKFIPLKSIALYKLARLILFISTIMGAVVYYLTLKINFIFTIPIGVVVYGTLLLLTGVADRAMIQRVWEKISIKNKV